MKDSILLYTSQYEAIKLLNDTQKAALLDAIYLFALGEDYEIKDISVKAIFSFIKNQIEIDNTKYEQKCAKNKSNGHLGGRPPKEKPNGFSENQTVISKTERLSEKPNGYFENHNDNDNVNDNVNENDNDVNNKGIINNSSEERTKSSPFPKDIEEICFYYNSQMLGKTIKPMRRVKTESTVHRNIRARINEYSIEEVKEVIRLAAASAFLNGCSQKGFVANADWIFLPNNFQKIYNGNYNTEVTGGDYETKQALEDYNEVAMQFAKLRSDKN